MVKEKNYSHKGKKKWISMATDEEEMKQYHEEAGKNKGKIKARINLQPPHHQLHYRNPQNDGIKSHTSGEDVTSNIPDTSTSHDKPTSSSRRTILLILLGVFVIVAIATTAAVVLALQTNVEDETEFLGQYSIEVRVTNHNFSSAMSNTTSNDFFSVADPFCEEVDRLFYESKFQERYEGCIVHRLSNGSIELSFVITIMSKNQQQVSKQEVNDILTGLHKDEPDATIVQLGKEFVFLKSSLTVNVSKTTVDNNPVPKKVDYQEACSPEGSRSGCLTGNATCTNGKCECPSYEYYYDIEPNLCLLYDCGDIPTVDHSTITDATRLQFKVDCQIGHNIDGNNVIMCNKNGEWESIPICIPIKCPILKSDNSRSEPIEGHVNTFGKMITIKCQDGYEIADTIIESNVTCQLNQTWSGLTSCLPIQCMDYIYGEFTTKHGKTLTLSFGQTATINCESGYEIIGSSRVECFSNKSFGSEPVCDSVKCFEYSPSGKIIINNSTATPNSQPVYKDAIDVTCEAGYETEDSTTIVCQADKTWSKDPVCTKVECPTYVNPQHALLNPDKSDGYRFEDELNITCDNGYEIEGDSVVLCRANKTWSPSPKCNPIACPELVLSGHYLIQTEDDFDSTYGQTIVVTCEEGYEVVGESNVTCQANKTWSTIPSCNPVSCVTFNKPAFSSVHSTTGDTFTDIVTISCDLGYQLRGTNISTCQSNKMWSKVGTCEPIICDSFDFPENSIQTEVGQVEFGTQITVECQEFFFLVGNSKQTCNPDGSWNATECKIIPCNGTISIPTNGRVINSSETTLIIKCDNGYEMDGLNEVTCRNGYWDEVPFCNPVNCSEFSLPDNSILNTSLPSGNSYSDIKVVYCDDGYILNGTGEAICQADKTWLTDAECNPVDCGQPNDRNDAFFVAPYKTTFGETITVTCDTGYTLETPSSIICQADGTWDDPAPLCNFTACNRFKNPENGFVTLPGDKTAVFACNKGYFVNGNAITNCLDNVEIDYASKCAPIYCGEYIPSFNIANVSSNGTIYTSVASVVCRDGFYLFDDNEFSVYCNENGEWIGNPICNKTGISKFTASNYTFNVESASSIACNIREANNWKKIAIFQQDYSTESLFEILTIAQENGKFNNVSLLEYFALLPSSILRTESAEIRIEIDPLPCEDKPLQLWCGVDIRDDASSIDFSGDNIDGTTVYVTSLPETPELLLPKGIHQDRQSTLRCAGGIGKSELSISIASMYLEIKSEGTNEFVTANASVETTINGCKIEQTLTFTFTADMSWNNTQVRCRTSTEDENWISDLRTIVVLESFVGFGLPEYTFSIGSVEHFTCELINLPDWTEIKIYKGTKDESDGYILKVQKTLDEKTEIMPLQHVRIHSNSTFLDDKAELVVEFDTVQCSDADVVAEGTVYSCAVKVNDAWKEDTTSVIVQKNAEKPELTVNIGITEELYKDDLFECTAQVGNPPGYLILQKQHVCGIFVDVVDFAVFSNDTIPEDCGYRQSLSFNGSLSASWDKTNIRCVVIPANEKGNEEVVSDTTSIDLVLNIACSDNNNLIVHPYRCHDYINCDALPDPLRRQTCGTERCLETSTGWCTAEACTSMCDQNESETTPSLPTVPSPVLNDEVTTPEITATTFYENQQANISCVGRIGHSITSSRIMVLNLQSEGLDNVTVIQGVRDESICTSIVSITHTFIATRDMDGTNVWCAIIGGDVEYSSDILTLSLIDPVISIWTSSQPWSIDSSSLVQCEVNTKVITGEIVINKLLPNGELKRFEVFIPQGSNSYTVVNLSGVAASSGDSGSFKLEFEATTCADEAVYICESISGDTVYRTEINANIQRISDTPKMTYAEELIEGLEKNSLFKCEAQVGDPAGRLQIQTNRGDGKFAAIEGFEIDINSIVWADCGYYHTLSYYGAFDKSWDLTEMRCVVIHDQNLISNPDEFVSDSQIIYLVPASYCDNKGGLVNHPYDCNAYIGCDTVPFRSFLCGEGRCLRIVDCIADTQCDICYIPLPKPEPPGTSHIECNKTVSGNISSDMTITCTTSDIQLTEIKVTYLDDILIFNETIAYFTSVSKGRMTLSYDSGTGHIQLVFTSVTCSDLNTYIFTINNKYSDTTYLDVNSIESAKSPSITSTQFYSGHEATITCVGNLGYPLTSRDMVMRLSKPGSGTTEETITDVVKNITKDKDTCTFVSTSNYTFVVEDQARRSRFWCLTTNKDDEPMLSGTTIFMVVQTAVLNITTSSQPWTIGELSTIACDASLAANYDGVTMYRRYEDQDPETILTYLTIGNKLDDNYIFGTKGSFQLAGSAATITLTFDSVRCSDEATYICSYDNSSIPKTQKEVIVIDNNIIRSPELTLPHTMIEGIATNDLDFLSCKADVGYPLRRNITILTNITGDFTEFTEVEPFIDPIVDYEKCSIEKTTKYRRIKFSMAWDKTRVKCILTDEDGSKTESLEQIIRIIPGNVCDVRTSDDFYIQHPYQCHSALWCLTTESVLTIYTYPCAAGKCPTWLDGVNKEHLRCDRCPSGCN